MDKIILKNAWNLSDEIFEEPIKERFELYDIYYYLSTKVYDFRIEKGWSQKKLAEFLGVTQAMVSKLESGEYNYTIEQLWKISKKLGWKLNINIEDVAKDNYKVCYEAEDALTNKISIFDELAVGA